MELKAKGVCAGDDGALNEKGARGEFPANNGDGCETLGTVSLVGTPNAGATLLSKI